MKKIKLPLIISLTLVVFTIQFCQSQQKPARPNIIFILADDLAYADIGPYGQKLIRTPNLNRMAKNGMRFTQFYSGTSVCAPSRSSLMTGMHTGHTYIRGNKEIKPEGQWPLPDSAVTIAEVMKKAGYVTGDFGKWGMGFVGTSGDPNKQGFDQFFGYNCQRQSHNFYPDHLWSNSERINLPNTPKSQTHYAAEIIQEKALSFIDNNKEKPFFLYLSYTLPHAALQGPKDNGFEEYRKKFNEQPQVIPSDWDGIGYEPQAYPKATFATMVTRLDTYVGQVMVKLKSLGLDDNTLIIFTSDNGPHTEGGHDPKFFNSTGVLKGVKRDLYEGGMRVPMLAYWPGKIKAGSVNNHIGAFWDFMPTFASIINQKVPAMIDGISILPTLLGKGKQQQHTYLYWEFHELGGRQAVRMGKWKGVKYNVLDRSKTTLELYDLEKDPGETKNLASKYPIILKQIDNYIKEAHVENNIFPFLSKVENK
ncbi:MAG TPA: arylsulfatase [Sphingobacteriaceae bacterium]|nr:arylsulfatase [Sphingobacteriaceae bacterium]